MCTVHSRITNIEELRTRRRHLRFHSLDSCSRVLPLLVCRRNIFVQHSKTFASRTCMGQRQLEMGWCVRHTYTHTRTHQLCPMQVLTRKGLAMLYEYGSKHSRARIQAVISQVSSASTKLFYVGDARVDRSHQPTRRSIVPAQRVVIMCGVCVCVLHLQNLWMGSFALLRWRWTIIAAKVQWFAAPTIGSVSM